MTVAPAGTWLAHLIAARGPASSLLLWGRFARPTWWWMVEASPLPR